MTSIRERAAVFLQEHDSKRLVVGQHDWHYYTGGGGDPVLLLSGGAGIGIGWIDLAHALVPRFRTLAPDYPSSVGSCAELVDGLVALLDAEGIDLVHVVGQSAGGMFAELLSRRAPDRVRSLILSSTGLYGPEDVERLRMRVETTLATPWSETQEAIRTALRGTWKDSDDAEFWIEQVVSTSDAAGSAGAANSYRLLLELAEGVDELMRGPAWDGPTLIFRADDDPLITTSHTERLRELHPNCDFRTFAEGGHSLLLSRTADYIDVVHEFLTAS
ncbi:alpha/beta fold hydrolase [Nocardia iowensis]|uniref:Alpha/beta hydrolase n=1 Tax=Nocardia iowensis TaxID=204891 RepID=A0ABX8RQ46_NOCIO|nr:alpha/beta hydrolase [Nocardia iowensis]QXN89566.1 alpha/beta hydrolase [Nocardia iowensis]